MNYCGNAAKIMRNTLTANQLANTLPRLSTHWYVADAAEMLRRCHETNCGNAMEKAASRLAKPLQRLFRETSRICQDAMKRTAENAVKQPVHKCCKAVLKFSMKWARADMAAPLNVAGGYPVCASKHLVSFAGVP